MAFHVNNDCIGCGLCTGVAPEVFALTDAGQAAAVAQPADPGPAREALSQCPVSAIWED